MVYLLNLTGIWVIVALGLNLLIGSTGLISLGHAAFLAVGAYTAGVLANKTFVRATDWIRFERPAQVAQKAE